MFHPEIFQPTENKKTNLFFVGVMGVGKTSQSSILAKDMGFDHYGADGEYLKSKGEDVKWDDLKETMSLDEMNGLIKLLNG